MLHQEGSGAVAQLGERLLCKQEVRGSNPRRSTTVGRGILVRGFRFFFARFVIVTIGYSPIGT